MARESRREGRGRRHERVREKIRGSASRPRLAVFRSLVHIYAQLIDDDAGATLVTASSVNAKEIKASKISLMPVGLLKEKPHPKMIKMPHLWRIPS